jgi:hypothetical protein
MNIEKNKDPCKVSIICNENYTKVAKINCQILGTLSIETIVVF